MSYAAFPPLSESVVRASIADVGFPEAVAERYAKLIRDANRALDEANVSSTGRRTWIVPGRIELLGKHVDYAGGRSLLCTVERGIVVVASPRTDRNVLCRDARRRESMVVSLDPSPFPATQAPLPWAVYPRTVVRRLQHNFGHLVVGADIALASNLPPAAGVSSSSALVVGLTLALSALSNLASDARWHEALVPRTALAGYCGAMENGLDFGILAGERGVGTLGGAQDQTAILCCAPGKLDVFGWAPVRHERAVSWPSDHVFVIGVSGVVASKAGGARERYNRVARTSHRLVHAWNTQGGSARTLSDVFTEAAGGDPVSGVPQSLLHVAHEAADTEFPEAHLIGRLHQFHRETWHHVPAAAEAIARGDLAAFADIVAASQHGAEVALGNQIAETIQLVTLARDIGAVAASAFGAGFGGSVWAMIPAVDAERFASRWRDRYATLFPHVANRVQVFETRPGAPAFESI